MYYVSLPRVIRCKYWIWMRSPAPARSPARISCCSVCIFIANHCSGTKLSHPNFLNLASHNPFLVVFFFLFFAVMFFLRPRDRLLRDERDFQVARKAGVHQAAGRRDDRERGARAGLSMEAFLGLHFYLPSCFSSLCSSINQSINQRVFVLVVLLCFSFSDFFLLFDVCDSLQFVLLPGILYSYMLSIRFFS